MGSRCDICGKLWNKSGTCDCTTWTWGTGWAGSELYKWLQEHPSETFVSPEPVKVDKLSGVILGFTETLKEAVSKLERDIQSYLSTTTASSSATEAKGRPFPVPSKWLDLSVGDRVRFKHQPLWGNGTVVAVEPSFYSVRMDCMPDRRFGLSKEISGNFIELIPYYEV